LGAYSQPYDRRVVRERFEERFTDARMAKEYVSTYRQLLRIGSCNGKTPAIRLHQLHLNGGNGSTAVSTEKPLPAL